MLTVWTLSAFAGVEVVGEVRGGDTRVAFHRSAGEDDAASVTSFFDPHGSRWDVAMDAEPVGPEAIVLIRVRVTDDHGRVVAAYQPDLRVALGEPFRVKLGNLRDPAHIVEVSGTLTADGRAAPQIMRRSSFVSPRARSYPLTGNGWRSLSCEGAKVESGPFPSQFTIEGRRTPGEQVSCAVVTDDGPATLIASFL